MSHYRNQTLTILLRFGCVQTLTTKPNMTNSFEMDYGWSVSAQYQLGLAARQAALTTRRSVCLRHENVRRRVTLKV